LAQLGHCLAGKRFDLEPDFKFSRLRPKIAHLRAGIAIDHRRKIRARGRLEKRFSRQKKRRSDGDHPPERRSENDFSFGRLADASAIETAVAVDAHLTAAEQIGNRRYGFFRVFRARAHREDEIAQGKLRTGFQNLGILFHSALFLRAN